MSKKGSNFERQICRQLSLWWSGGIRDDVFWRTSQSGGRATQRAKFGKDTYGSYGDVAAVDPVGTPLLKVFTIELKRGRSHGSPWELLDAKPTSKERPFERAINQAVLSAIRAGSKYWMLICRRDHKVAMVYTDADVLKEEGISDAFRRTGVLRFDVEVNQPRGGPVRVRFVGTTLESFLNRVQPLQVQICCKKTGGNWVFARDNKGVWKSKQKSEGKEQKCKRTK